MTIRTIIGVLAAASLLSLSACTSTVEYGGATRIKVIKQDVGNKKLVTASEKMIRHLITYPTIEDLLQRKRLKLAVSPLTDQTTDNIDTDLILDSMTQQLTQSGKFSVTDKNSVIQAHAAATSGELFARVNVSVAKKIAARTNADYLLYGSLRNVIRVGNTDKEVYYSMNLHLLNTKTGKLIWQDNEEILKSSKKTLFGI